MSNYFEKAKYDAKETVREFQREILEQLLEMNNASDDLHNNYGSGDSYHHESHVDVAYRLLEAAELLNELVDYEETDCGLWHGLEPRQAICAQAAYTYGNAVYEVWRDLIVSINNKAADIIEDFDNRIEDAEKDMAQAADACEKYNGLTPDELEKEKATELEAIINEVIEE